MQHIVQAGLIAPSSRTAAPARLYRPGDCQAALAALDGEERPPTLVAGGTDLCAQFNEGLAPTALVALDRVAELAGITVTESELRIGAMVTHADGAGNPSVRQHLPGFAEAWRRIANVRVRYWATIGGNVMARRPRYEMSVLLSALGGRLRFVRGTGEMVECAPEEIWAGKVPERGLLHHVAIPLSEGATRFHYDRSLRPVMTLAFCHSESGVRAAIATERLRPVVLPVDLDLDDPAGHAFADLPESFSDAATSRWYLARAGEVLLRRAVERLRHD